jgi:hypothetical protein
LFTHIGVARSAKPFDDDEMPGRRALPLDECLALQAELELLYRKHGSDQAVANWLEVSQQSVHRARTSGRIGPVIAAAVYDLLGVSKEVLMTKHAGIRPRTKPRAPAANAEDEAESDLKLPPDKFRERAIAARRALRAKGWNISPSAVKYVCEAPEWQSPRFSVRDAVFWVEQMRVQTAEEARASTTTEEGRIFQEVLQEVHVRQAKTARRKRSRAGEEASPESRRFKKAAG